MAASGDPSQIAGSESLADDSNGIIKTSESSQTAKDFIETQLRLEADAREALPYAFDTCTQPLGPLRQNLFSCLTCNPPSTLHSDPYTPAAVCYSCSIACHGEHTLVELFNRRNFTCDCGTTSLPSTSPCTLRIDPVTGLKGPVHSQETAHGNTYNQNCRNRFCGCGEEYDAHTEKGTMFQCLGLADEKDGGCGEDWWHPECVIWGGETGKRKRTEAKERSKQVPEAADLPPSDFPDEDDFETFICYKCVNAAPWIKQYAGTEGFLPPLDRRDLQEGDTPNGHSTEIHQESATVSGDGLSQNGASSPKKRSADAAGFDSTESDSSTKKVRPDEEPATATDLVSAAAYHNSLPPMPSTTLSLFCKEDFRDHLCRCRECYPRLSKFPQLLEEEEAYEPPLSESDDGGDRTGSIGSRSILERGEAALSNVDRVRAIG